jgi:glutamyl-tRNA(Gln) amidotransferase subunit E
MYPETDIPPIEITKEMQRAAKSAAQRVQASEEEKEKLLSPLNEELRLQLSSARGLISSTKPLKLHLAPELLAFAAAVKTGIEPKFAATTITNTLQSLKREGENTKNLDENRLSEAFAACQKKAFTKAAMPEILRAMCNDASLSAQGAAKKLGLEKISATELRKIIEDEKLDMKGLMAKYRLKIEASEAAELLKSAHK